MPGIAPTNPLDAGNFDLGTSKTYSAALDVNAGDYDKIMQGYRDLMSSRTPTQQLSYTPITPKLATYSNSPGLSSAMSRFKSAADTGGYQGDELANIRARAVSPIRSIYSNAMQGVQRQRSLQGGYSPNYSAVMAKMARELSSQVADKTTDVEGMIGENVSRNRLSALSGLAPLAAEENRSRSAFDLENNRRTDEADRLNRLIPLQYQQANQQAAGSDFDRVMEAIRGMNSMYGTTPGMTSTIGGQVMQNQGMNQQNRQANMSLEQRRAELRQQQEQAAMQFAASMAGRR